MTAAVQWQSTPYLLLLFVATVTSFLWALYGVRRLQAGARTPYVGSFVVLCLAVASWSAAYAVQLATPTLEGKLVVYTVVHVGGVLVPPAWLAFAMTYTGRSEWLSPATIAGLLAIPIALLVTLPTNPFSLALTGASVETVGSLTVLATSHGPLYQLHLAYSYVAIVAGTGLIVVAALRAPAPIRRQSILVVAGAGVPLLLNVLDVLAVPPVGDVGVNLTPVSLSLSTVLFGVAIVRYRLLDVTPVAWDAVLAQMVEGVIVLDERERVVELNAAAEAIVGASEAVLGTPISSLLPRVDELTRDTPVLVSLEGADGRERSIQLTRSPLTEYGETYGWVVVAQDVTTLERQRRALEAKNERLDEFATLVSHDLRNPLTVIGGFTELARETGDPAHFEKVQDAVARMATFLEELLLLARQGESVGERRPVSLAGLADSVGTTVADDRLHVVTETDAVVLADENRLRQLFDNLFRNARDHNEGGVTVRVEAVADGFAVEDDGVGIPAETRPTVFDVGVSTRAEGSGFGLAIVREIVDAHGWSIAVTEGPTGGARFEITGVDVETPEQPA